MPRGPWPLTERVLHILPGRKTVWIAVWAATPLLQFLFPALPGRLYQVHAVSRLDLLMWTYTNVVVLFGLGWLSAQLHAIGPLMERVAPEHHSMASGSLFQATGSIWGPVALALAVIVLNAVLAVIRRAGIAVLAGAVVVFVSLLPLATGAWVYFAMLFDLDHIGRMHLTLLPFEEDRSLGLRPLGTVAFSGFLAATAVLAPIIIYTATDARRLVANLALYLISALLLVIGLYRLHRQMWEVKKDHLAWARGRYARAVKAVRGDPSGAALRAHADELQAAEALERRAAAILEWPFDETLLARAAGIATGVVTALIARLILNTVGM